MKSTAKKLFVTVLAIGLLATGAIGLAQGYRNSKGEGVGLLAE